MAVEKLLNLTRIDVLAAANDHVLDPSDDVEVSLVVHCREVAGVHPAPSVDSLSRPFVIVPIPAHDDVSTAAQLASLAAVDYVAGRRVDDFDLHVWMHAADPR